MELKSFAEEGFDPKVWINKAWRSNGNQEKEIFVANTVTRLQLYMKQLTNSLDETTTQIVTSIPRIIQDASSLQLEGALLQQKLLSLEQKVQSVEEQTGHSIESLQKIDTLKSRLESAASALREADKWAALASSLEDILDSGVPTQGDKLAELCEQVAAMTASLEVLSDAPDYENKKLQLETLYNRLEAAVSPPLIEALTQMDAERSSRYVSLFAGMSRGVSVCRCWRRAAAARLAVTWRRRDAHSVPALTALLAADANKQVDWLTNVLKSETPLAELVRLYTDLLLSLEPAPTKVASANLRLCSSPEEGILLLTDLRSDIEEFVNCIKGVIEAPRQNKETLLPATLREFGRAAYAPLRELLPKYTDMQTQLLIDNLQDPQLKQEDLLEQSRAILVIAERCEGWLSTAHSKAKKIAGEAMYAVYMPAIEEAILSPSSIAPECMAWKLFSCKDSSDGVDMFCAWMITVCQKLYFILRLQNFTSTLSNLISSHSRRIESSFLAAVTTGQTTGVLSPSFPASLLLESAVTTVLDTLAKGQKDEEIVTTDPLTDLPTLLLEAEVRNRLASFRNEPVASVAVLRRTKDQLRNLARAVLRNPVDLQLDKIPQLSVWSNNDALSTELPDFALSPQEYITEIGQYLMTLPQHLEMHLSEKQAPLQFLSDVCNHTCEIYAEKILNIRNMDALGTKRCLNDIVYLSSVVEDLGSTITPALRSLEKSLRAATPSQTADQ